MNKIQNTFKLIIFLLISFALGFYINSLFLKQKIKEPSVPKVELEKEQTLKSLILKGENLSLKSNILSIIDINNDGKDEIINRVKTASWTDNVYILTPKEDGTFGLFCEHCHFFYHAGNKGIEFEDLNNDNILDVKLWFEPDSKEPELFYFINGDYIKK